jgi:Cu(I)/Ag(I) efflux system membrane fusion protein
MTSSSSRKTKHLRVAAIVMLLIAAAGSVAIFFAPRNNAGIAGESAGTWTCSMHPQVRLPKPGKCPICSMPLIRAGTTGEQRDSAAAGSEPMLQLSEHARAMASVETAPVERRKLSHEIRAIGKVQYNERGLATITARVDGYIERLFIDFTGVEVKAGDHLVEIYSPDLVTGQQELLLASEGSPIAAAAKLKLRRWEMTDAQIAELLRTRKVNDRLTLVSPISGTVTEKMVVQKSAVKAGDVLYRLANLDSVWVYLDVYEYELPWVRYGQPVEITTEASPGETFNGRVWFINPVLTDESRTVKVLVNIANKDKKLKPGMFVSTTIRAALLASGQLAPTGVEGQWTCAMHPQVLQPEGGECPVCKMELTQIPVRAKPASPEEELILAVPATAVLDSGMRKLAYVERAPGEYIAVELKLGPRAGDYYPVIEGLKEGDRVAVRGNFLLDSQFQIRGLPSLFYEHGQAPAAGHPHGAPAGKPTPAKPSGHEEHTTPKPVEHKHQP